VLKIFFGGGEGGGAGEPFQITGDRQFCIFFVFHYFSTVQINRFRINPSYTAVASQSFRFGVKIFRSPAP